VEALADYGGPVEMLPALYSAYMQDGGAGAEARSGGCSGDEVTLKALRVPAHFAARLGQDEEGQVEEVDEGWMYRCVGEVPVLLVGAVRSLVRL
jgi:hypothetical protein